MKDGLFILGAGGNIGGMPGWDFLSLVREGEGPVCGVMAIRQEILEIKAFPARAVVCSQPGIGVAASLLYGQGATLANGEFFQFHPAFISGGETPFCLGDSVLEAGGRFWAEKNGKRWDFLEEIYPDYGNRVPRLVLNRTLHKIAQDLGQVYLDLTGITPTDGLKPLFSKIRRRFKIDPSKESVPVEPRLFRSLGGIWSDHRQMSSIPGLFTGEEGAAAIGAKKGNQEALLEEATRVWHSRIRQLLNAGGPENVYRLCQEMKECLETSLGLARDNKKLKKADEKMGELSKRCGQISLADKGKHSNRELKLALALPALLDAGRASVLGALLRNESRGEHYKPEFPNQDDKKFLKKTKAVWSPNGPQIEYENVQSLFQD